MRAVAFLRQLCSSTAERFRRHRDRVREGGEGGREGWEGGRAGGRAGGQERVGEGGRALEGGGGPDHVACRRVQHPLGLARGACYNIYYLFIIYYNCYCYCYYY